MAELVKTIENVDELFAQIEVNGQTFVSERYVPHTEYVPRRENNTDLHSTAPVPQQAPSAPVQGEDVYAVELNNVLHDFDDRELAVELQEEATARSNADTALRNDLNAEISARENADTALGNAISAEATARQNADIALGNDIGAEATARQNTDTALSGDITTNANAISAINAKIPNQASAQNQLADKNFVNSSIATNTADYISNNGQPFNSVAELEAYSGTVTNNDYAFVTGVDASGNTYYDRYKATVTGGTVTWALEYRLNNSSFTAEQWATINSGLTQSSVDSDIEDAIKALDVASVGGNGKYIKSISQVDGKIVAVEDNLTATGGLAFTGTRAQYEQAKLIPVGQVGHIPSGALVNITDENRTYETSGTGSGQTLSLIARVMKAGDGITITSDDAIKADTVTFTGTRAQWEALSTAQKAKFNIVNITDEELTDDVITDTVEVGNMKAVTSNAVGELFKFRSYTRISAGEQLAPKDYNEFEIENADLPIAIQGYKVVAHYVEQVIKDAFLMQLHKSVGGKWRLTVFNCASVTQTIPDIIINVLFMKE